MSLFIPPLISLFFFSGIALAGLYAPDCSSDWAWSFNSLGQNPCTVAAYMLSTCHAGSFTVQPLQPGYHYSGPTSTQGGDLCLCNTVAYSLLSACDACQLSDWISWSDFSNNCTRTLPPGTFPNPIPAGTSLERWAIFDVTPANNWNPNISKALVGPEFGPGTNLNPTGTSASTTSSYAFPSTAASTTSPSSSSTSSNSLGSSVNSASPIPIGGHTSHTGAIVGGVAGSIAGISILIAAVLFYLRRRQSPAPSASSVSDGQPGGFNPLMDQVPRSMSGRGTVTSSLPDTTSVQRQSNPDELAAYPAYQGLSPPPTYHPIISPSPSSSRNLYTVATAPGSQGQQPVSVV